MSTVGKLQGLQVGRGLAALAVVIFHAKLTLIRFPEGSYFKLPYFYSHGDIGVPFFFVISGFIISYVLDKGSFSIRGFFIKRIFRLWPTYFFCTILYATIYLVHRDISASELDYSFRYLVQSLLFWPLPNYPVLPPGWSLEHEVLFYIFAAIAAKFFGVRGVLYGLVVLVSISVFFRLVYPVMSGTTIGWDYHILAPINLCFLFGVALFLFWKHRSKTSNVLIPRWWLFLGIALILLAPYLTELIPNLSNNSVVNRDLKFGFIRFLIEATASVILLYGLLGVNATSMPTKIIAAIGDRSYSLYLCHFMYVSIFQYIHREHIKWPQEAAEILCILFVIVSVLTSFVIHWCVERPSSRFGNRLAQKID